MTAPLSPATTEMKDPWQTRVITATPVILSVLATVLAGLSSRELTLAHYYRSLATQEQSRAGDQWNFFQAKRVRGTIMETAAAGAPGLAAADPVDAAHLEATAAHLAGIVEQLQRDTDQLRQSTDRARTELGPAHEPLAGAVGRLAATLRRQADMLDTAHTKLQQALARPSMPEALGDLATATVPTIEEHTLKDADILAALAAVDARAPDSRTDPLVARIAPEQLQAAIEDAGANAREFDERTRPVGKDLQELEAVVANQSAAVRACLRGVRAVRAAAVAVPSGEARGLADVRAGLAALERTAATLRATASEEGQDFRAAYQRYTARRYDQEAHYNQALAEVRELVVREDGLISESHRRKSAWFFYCMLAAQGGVTVATLALSIRYRSFLWGLATVAGLTAVLFASYIYLGM